MTYDGLTVAQRQTLTYLVELGHLPAQAGAIKDKGIPIKVLFELRELGMVTTAACETSAMRCFKVTGYGRKVARLEAPHGN